MTHWWVHLSFSQASIVLCLFALFLIVCVLIVSEHRVPRLHVRRGPHMRDCRRNGPEAPGTYR
jgi:hypothetical protein